MITSALKRSEAASEIAVDLNLSNMRDDDLFDSTLKAGLTLFAHLTEITTRFNEGKRTKKYYLGYKNWDTLIDEKLRTLDGKPVATSRQARNILNGDPSGRKNRNPKRSAEEPSAPSLRRKNSDGTTTPIPPAQYTAGDALVNAKQFLDSVVSDLSPEDAATFHRSLIQHLEDILNKVSVGRAA